MKSRKTSPKTSFLVLSMALPLLTTTSGCLEEGYAEDGEETYMGADWDEHFDRFADEYEEIEALEIAGEDGWGEFHDPIDEQFEKNGQVENVATDEENREVTLDDEKPYDEAEFNALGD